jgi:hypothetical protein
MKLKLIIGLFILSIAFSCKSKEGEQVKEENPTEASASPTSIQLANYSDENWENGVGITFNMLLVDFSNDKEALIAKGSELTLADGKKINYVGYEVKKNYIQILLKEKPSFYQSAIEYPNEIIIK